MCNSALIYAQRMINSGEYHETEGPNRSPAIDQLCRDFGDPLGSSWCALFQSRAFKDARLSGCTGETFPYDGRCHIIRAWFEERGWTSTNANDLMEWKGAVVIRHDKFNGRGHIAMVKSRFTSGSAVVEAVGTLEGNTNSVGGSDGDGAYEKRREVPLSPYTWSFCRTDLIAGGAWWD